MAEDKPVRSAPPPKKGFIRSRIPTSERIASATLLILLVAIGVTIYLKGRNYDPNRFSLREEALAPTAQKVEGKAATIRQPDTKDTSAPNINESDDRAGAVESNTIAESAAETPAAETPVAETPVAETPVAETPVAETPVAETPVAETPVAETPVAEIPVAETPAANVPEPMEVSVDNLEPLGETEFYDKDTLFEKINGRAPAYFEFGFKKLRARSFGVSGSPASFIDVLEFEMDSPVSAFGIFSAEREEGGKPLDFAEDGYASEMGYFFRRGSRYVQVIASDQDPRTMRLAEAIARDRASNLPGGDEGLAARRRLPEAGIKPGTVEFIQSNAFGQSTLHNVFQARYDTEHGEVAFFVMLGKPAEIDAAWQGYRKFVKKFGQIHESYEEGNERGFVGESFGNWIAIYAHSNEIGGVVEAESSEAARAFVRKHLETP